VGASQCLYPERQSQQNALKLHLQYYVPCQTQHAVPYAFDGCDSSHFLHWAVMAALAHLQAVQVAMHMDLHSAAFAKELRF
jgi:hypothetical protein